MMLDAHHSSTATGREHKPSMELTTGYQVYLPDMYAPGTIGFCRPLPGEKNSNKLAQDSVCYQKALMCKLIDWPDSRQPTLYRVLLHATGQLRITNQIVFLRGVYDARSTDFGTNTNTVETLIDQLLPTTWDPFTSEVHIDGPILTSPEDHLLPDTSATQGGQTRS